MIPSPISYVRVINGQRLNRSILLDKIDRTSAQFETGISYAQLAKQQVYVPYVNPVDTTVAGYTDLVPTDEVLLQLNQPHGVIAKLISKGYVSIFAHAGSLVVAPKVTAAAHHAIGGSVNSGIAGTISTASGGMALFADSAPAANWTTADIGKDVNISTGAVANNNGTFKIVDIVTTKSIHIANPNATSVGETNNGTLVWSETAEAQVSITGTTFLSVTPDHTYVILSTAAGVTQTISDTAIIAAGAPSSISATSIIIDNALVTIGTPAAGWTVVVQANSKTSGTAVTLT